MKLIGSTTSPYVRRIRLLLGDRPYEFVSLDIYGEGRDELRRVNPALKVPLLQDDRHSIFDSRVIARYLQDKSAMAPLTWEQENLLTLIDAANDSFVTLLLSKRSGLDIEQDVLFYNLQHERIRMTFEELTKRVMSGDFREWHYPSICLYCLIDWIDFRNIFDFTGLETLLEFRDGSRERPMVKETDPRTA
jgi:glutathione S-transferase